MLASLLLAFAQYCDTLVILEVCLKKYEEVTGISGFSKHFQRAAKYCAMAFPWLTTYTAPGTGVALWHPTVGKKMESRNIKHELERTGLYRTAYIRVFWVPLLARAFPARHALQPSFAWEQEKGGH